VRALWAQAEGSQGQFCETSQGMPLNGHYI
jgi:hypothetical protein